MIAPRPHQLDALDALEKTFIEHRRAQVLMACGSGKTLIGPWHAQRAGAQQVVVLTPSLTLVHQTAAAWRQILPNCRLLVVCSDPTTAAGLEERAGEQDAYDELLGVGALPEVTTRPEVIAGYLDRHEPGRLTLIVGTYHSSPAIARALTLIDEQVGLDLIVMDEAHQLAGRASEAFSTALRDTLLPARQRVFMTATPVLLGNLADQDLDDLERLDGDQPLLSMDDEVTFGPVAYRLTAGDAIERGLLADYRVLVVAGEDEPEEAALQALVDAIRRHRVRRVLTFHSRVRGARRFAAAANLLGEVDGIVVHAEAVDGSMPAGDVRAALARLGDPAAADHVTVVSSAQVLREGIDVPAVDAVLFADPRSSSVQITQAVGRALRLHPDKSVGTIIIPLAVTAAEDDDDQLTASRFAHVWTVLRSLRLHDDRVGAQLDDLNRRWTVKGWRPSQLPTWLEVAGVDPAQLENVMTRAIRGTSAVWDHWYHLLLKEIERLGGVEKVTTSHVVGGRKLGVWLGGQRWAYRRRVLRQDKVERLEQVPGWTWSSSAATDLRTLATLTDLAARAGTATENLTGESAYTGLRCGIRRPLGRTLAAWRHEHRNGTLDRYLVDELNALPGWQWEPLDPPDRAAVEALRLFGQWEKHGDVPEGHLEGDIALGDWVRNVRRRRLTGTLSPALVDELDTCLPLCKGGGSVWSWDHAGTLWDLSYDALCQFTQRAGKAYPMPTGHRETVDGLPVALYQWVAVQRHRHRKGHLTPDQVASLESVSGWLWKAPGVTKPAGEPIDLGGHPHGTAKGHAAKCPCLPCQEYSRRNGRKSLDKHASSIEAVDASHAAALIADVRAAVRVAITGDKRFEREPGAIAYAYAADVPVGLVRDLFNDRPTSTAQHNLDRLAALTAQQVLDLFDTVGSRGRLTMSLEQPTPSAPVLAQLEDMAARGWHRRWVARELGYKQLAVKVGNAPGDQCTKRLAQQVDRLYQRLGTRIAPDRSFGAVLPYLSDLERAAGWVQEQYERAIQRVTEVATTNPPTPVGAP